MMSTKTQIKNNSFEEVELKPSFRLPSIIVIFGLLLLLLPIKLWISIVITSFGFFLLIQSFTLRLRFTNKDLIVLQFNRELRRFPFKNWIAWRILWPKFPGLFYFREVASPHLLPIIFDPESLETQLRLHLPKLESKIQSQNSSNKSK